MIFFDLDGVMANFSKAAVKYTGQYYWPRHDNSIWEELGKIQNFYQKLDPLDDGIKLFRHVVDRYGLNSVQILTSLPNPTNELYTAESDKVQWVKQHVHPKARVNTCFGGTNKVSYLSDYPGAILIDDTEKNLESWIDNNGIGVLYEDAQSTIEKLKILGVL